MNQIECFDSKTPERILNPQLINRSGSIGSAPYDLISAPNCATWLVTVRLEALEFKLLESLNLPIR